MRKIIFLDIDGVVNSHDWYERREKLPPTSSREAFKKNEFDPAAVQLLQALLVDTEADVVLSSTWRLYEEDHQVIRDCVCDFIDVTGESECRMRGCEIREWINKNIPYKERDELQYAIIDDDSDMLLWQKDNFFQTSFMHGLTQEICDKIRKHFGVNN